MKVTLYSTDPALREVSHRGLCVRFENGQAEVDTADVEELLATFPLLCRRKPRRGSVTTAPIPEPAPVSAPPPSP